MRKPRHRKPLPKDPTMRKIAASPDTVQKIADHFKVTYMAVRQWPKVPSGRVLGVSKLTGLPPHKIRPDLYPR